MKNISLNTIKNSTHCKNGLIWSEGSGLCYGLGFWKAVFPLMCLPCLHEISTNAHVEIDLDFRAYTTYVVTNEKKKYESDFLIYHRQVHDECTWFLWVIGMVGTDSGRH